jgi:Bacterial SH3 domain
MINRIYTKGPLAAFENQNPARIPQSEQVGSPIGFHSNPLLHTQQPDQQAALEPIKLDNAGDVPSLLSIEAIPEAAYKPKRPKVSPAVPPEPQVTAASMTGSNDSFWPKEVPRSVIWGAGMGFVLFIGMVVTIQFYDTKQVQKVSVVRSSQEEKSMLIATQTFVAPTIGQARVSKALVLHERASEKSKILGELSAGLEVEILKYATYFDVHKGENGKWVKIRYKKQEGWCWGGDLE